jgi:hypothetical protein
MNKMVVVVFDDERTAYGGLKALKELQKRLEEVRADTKARADKLFNAWQLIKEAAA